MLLRLTLCCAFLITPSHFVLRSCLTHLSTDLVLFVLLQQGRPVAFMSKKLSAAERNYTTGEQELLAVVQALREWRCYLEGQPFVVKTDHKPLTFLQVFLR